MNPELMAIGVLSVFVIAVCVCIWGLWRLLRCVHAWELVDKTELPSGIETLGKVGVSSPVSYLPWDLPRLTQKTIIIAMRCPKCGAARIYKESA